MQSRHLTLPLWLVALVAIAAVAAWAPGTAGAQSTPSDYHPPDTRTDVEELNALIEAIVNGDSEAIADLAAFFDVECSVVRELGSGPECPEGVPDGTPISVFTYSACEGAYLEGRATVAAIFAALFDDHEFLIYAIQETPSDYPRDAAYRLIFGTAPDDWGLALDVRSDGAIVASVQCGPPANMVLPAGTYILTPFESPTPEPAKPTETPTAEQPTSTPTTTPPTNTPTAEPETPTATPTPTVGQPTATPTATPTRPAPAPPNTGSGSGGSDNGDTVLWLVIVAGVAVAAASASAFAVSRRA